MTSRNRKSNRRFTVAVIALAIALLATACGSDNPPRPAPGATPTVSGPTAIQVPNPWAIPGLVDPANVGWPRALSLDGEEIVIEAPPRRLHTLSLGHDEIVVALVGPDSLAGVGSFTANETYSNVATEVAGLSQIGRDAEEVVSLDPDLVIASKFTAQDLVDTIRGAGIKVVRTNLESSAEGHEANIRLLAYMLGAEERGEALIVQIRSRLDRVAEAIEQADIGRPGVLSIARFSDSISAAGFDSTEGGIIVQAGGVNVAAEAGISGHETISLESIIAMNPDVIVITQPEPGASDLANELRSEPALSGVPAVTNDQIMLGDPRFFTTLSHWNVRGVEDLAAALYPDQFQGIEFEGFE